VEYRSVGYVNVGIMIRVNISVNLSQLRGFMEIGSMEVYLQVAISGIGVTYSGKRRRLMMVSACALRQLYTTFTGFRCISESFLRPSSICGNVSVAFAPCIFTRTLRARGRFLSRVSKLTRDIDITILSVRLSVRDVPVSDENGLTYRHRFFTIR